MRRYLDELREKGLVETEGKRNYMYYMIGKGEEKGEEKNPEGIEMAYLHLIDNITGADIDLLAHPSYTFEGNTTDYASRFRLVFVANDANLGGEGNDDFAFISNGQIILNGVTDSSVLQIIDVTGRIVSSHNINSAFRISNSAFTPGVYVLRLINGENVKTQKIVIR